MPPQAIPASLEWILSYGYLFIFLGMLIEGPIVTTAAAFAAAFGYFDVYIVLILGFFADFTADLFYYGLGYWGRQNIVERYGSKFGLKKELIEKIESYIKRHAVKGLIIAKFIPLIPTLALIIAGAARISFKKFLAIVSIVIIPRTILFTAIGFYFGEAYEKIANTIDNITLTLILLALLVGGIYYYYKKALARIGEQLEKIEGLK